MKRQSFYLWLIIIIGSILRLYKLDFQSLWIDEAGQYDIANSNGINGVLNRALALSGHPPLSYLINYVLLLAGDSDFFLRLPSALFGIGSLALCAVLARQIISKHAAIFAVLVFAVSPFHIWYSQEARSYSQLVFFALLSSVLLLKALGDIRLRWWAFYILAVTGGMYTHIFMSLAVIAQFLWVFLCQRRHLLLYSACGAASAVLFLPFLNSLLQTYSRRSASGSIIAAAGFSWGALPYTFYVYSIGFSLGPSVAELHEDRSLGFILQFTPILLVVGVVFGTLLAIGIFALYTQYDRKVLVICLCSIFIPILAVFTLSTVPWFTFNVRYTIVAFPYFCILIGISCAFLYLKRKIVSIAFLLSLLGLELFSLYNYFHDPLYAKEDVRSAIMFWRDNSKNDRIFSYASYLTVDRYLTIPEKERHISLKTLDIVDEICSVPSMQGNAFSYILLTRDWHRVRENVIRNTLLIDNEESYPGVKIFRVHSVCDMKPLPPASTSVDRSTNFRP